MERIEAKVGICICLLKKINTIDYFKLIVNTIHNVLTIIETCVSV